MVAGVPTTARTSLSDAERVAVVNVIVSAQRHTLGDTLRFVLTDVARVLGVPPDSVAALLRPELRRSLETPIVSDRPRDVISLDSLVATDTGQFGYLSIRRGEFIYRERMTVTRVPIRWYVEEIWVSGIAQI